MIGANVKLPLLRMLFGAAHSGSRPPLIASILQWLTGTTDGETIDDSRDIVRPVPGVGGVNVLSTNGSSTFLNTGFTPASTDTIILDCEIITYGANINNQPIFGSIGAVGCGIYVGHSNNQYYVVYGNVSKYSGVLTVVGGWNEIKLIGGKLYVNDELKVDCSAGTFASEPSRPFYVGSYNNYGSPSNYGEIKFNNLRIGSGQQLPCGEGAELPLDVSGNGNDATANTADWSTHDDAYCWNFDKGFWTLENSYTVTEPTGGWSHSLDGTDGTLGELRDFIATLIYDAKRGTFGAYTLTNYSTDRTFDPDSTTLEEVTDVACSIAYDLENDSIGSWTVEEPDGGYDRTFDPTDGDLTLQEMADVLATFVHDATT